VLAGPMGWGSTELLRELALHGPGEIVLTGAVSAEDLDALFRGADLFVYPSTYEGFGLPVLEAMARGIPLVASSASALPEVFGDAAVGVDPSSVPAIADAIQRVLGDEQLRGELVQKGLARAETFSWDRTAEATLQVYERVSKR